MCPVRKFGLDVACIELHIRPIVWCTKVWCSIDELGKLAGVKVDLIEENYIKKTELRGVDAGHEIL
jgi:hypothetical protein